MPKLGTTAAAVAGLQARMSRVLSVSPQPQQQGASHPSAAAGQLPLQLGRGLLYSNPRAAVCRLQVLDVSGCPALALPVVPAAHAELFRSAVGAMSHLEGEPGPVTACVGTLCVNGCMRLYSGKAG